MAAYTDSLGFYKGTPAFPANVSGISKYEVTLDFAAIIAARAAAGATALAVSDTLEVVSLPAGSVVLTAGINVLSAESTNTTATLDLGLSGAASTYGSALVTNATGLKAATPSPSTVVAAGGALIVTLKTAVATDAVVKVVAFVANAN